MRKTTITAAALAMSASLAGLAYAAAPDGRSTENPSVVSPLSPAGDSSSPSGTPVLPPIPTTAGSGIDDRGGPGADDPVAHDVGDDHGGGGRASDDGPGHDEGDDRSGGGHGGRGHGSDD